MKQNTYRSDIDGIRALAVISVILFHLGLLPNGYLGVDIFFVISGYLITGIIYNEVISNEFSLTKFYERRIRRIIPLVLFSSFAALFLGIFFMLPDDLENLSQSVFASNFSSNNILMLITSSDYWAVKNDYKPLMHTWSLGVEEQFYLFYPLIFYFFKGRKSKYIPLLLIVLTFISLLLFLKSNNPSHKFYLIQYRFFELSIGGVFSIVFTKNLYFDNLFKKFNKILLLLIASLFVILIFNINITNNLKVLLVVIITAIILVMGANRSYDNIVYTSLFSNKVFCFIGKISFSLYMWHQIVFAFGRYIFFEEITLINGFILMLIVSFLSVLTYYYIENIFRNRKLINKTQLIYIVGLSFVILTCTSFYIYSLGGVIKKFPELGITKPVEKRNFFNKNDNINIQYNEKIRDLDKQFNEESKINILIIGDSFGRDFANILLESKFKSKIELSYFDYDSKNIQNDLNERIRKADFVFFATNKDFSKQRYYFFKNSYPSFDDKRVLIVGIKDFGKSNGIFYNRTTNSKRTSMKKGVKEINNKLQLEWGNQYINLIKFVSDSDGNVLVFTPDNKFISQDTLHLTKFGAIYFGELLNTTLNKILSQAL